MAFQRVTLTQLRAQLLDRLGSVGTFWNTDELNAGINEAVSIWQLLTGEKVVTITQTLASTTENLQNVSTVHANGKVLSVLRVAPSSGVSYREMSPYELDQGFYGWRTATAASTTQRPEYWAPLGVNKFFVYPRTGATNQTLSLLAYSDNTPLVSDGSYLDMDEAALSKVLGLAHALLSFKEGVPEGTDSAQPLKEMLQLAAASKNSEVTKFALYRNYMGQDESKGEPGVPDPQRGVRG